MKKTVLLGLLAVLASTALVAQTDIPLRNWTIPPYQGQSVDRAGITPMADITLNISFVAITVCRLLDTRPGTVWPLDGDGKYNADEIRTYTIPPACGIPTGTGAVSLNITATETNANPFGHIKIWPASQAEPNVSTLNWALGNQTVANAAIVGLSGAGQLRVKSGNAGSHVVIDVNAYFTGQPNAYFEAVGTRSGGGVGFFVNDSASDFSAGLRGLATAATGQTYGLSGENSSTSAASAGVLGFSVSRANVGPSFFHTGVRGESNASGNGVLGLIPSPGAGFAVAGFTYTGSTQVLAGRLGDEGSNLGVSYAGGLGGSGTKNFLEPHPTDAGKMIRYVSLEGPEAGTYFRGKGRFQNGIAVIDVPESFRIVTDPEGLSIQVTPIGQMATVAVQSIGLDRIVVRGSRNVEFFYTVNGVRTAYKDVEVITDNNFFRPESPDSLMPASLSPVERQRLIDNGTYKTDSTVNMETAHRLGWDRVWAERERPTPQPIEP
jgi:hypothetical protein